MAEHNKKGSFGEDYAAAYLARNGYFIKERNFVFEKAEIDIIAEKDNKLIVVEVKTRATEDYGNVADFVSNRQQKQIINATAGYLDLMEIDLETQFDIIAVILDQKPPKIDHIEEAFYPTL